MLFLGAKLGEQLTGMLFDLHNQKKKNQLLTLTTKVEIHSTSSGFQI